MGNFPAVSKSNKVLSYSIEGPDSEKFTISEETGTITFKAFPDFENPADAPAEGQSQGDNSYQLTIKVSDGTNSIELELIVKIINVDEDATSATPTNLVAKAADSSTLVAPSNKPIASLEASVTNTADVKVTFYNKGQALGEAVSATAGKAVFTPESPLESGEYVLTAKAMEPGKALSFASDPLSLSIGTTLPDAPSNLVLKAAEGTRTVSGTTTDEYIDTLEASAAAGDTVFFYNNDDSAKLGEAIAGSDGTATLELRGAKSLFDGVYSIYAKARNSAGELGLATPKRKLTINSTPKSLTLFAGDEQIPTSAVSTTLQVNGIEVSTREDRKIVFYDGSTKLGEATGTDAGKARLTLGSPLAIRTNPYTFSAKSEHPSGKLSAATAERSITVSAPTLAATPHSLKFYSGNTEINTGTTVTKSIDRITATAAPNATVQFLNNGTNLESAVRTDGSTGLATLNLTIPLGNGRYSITATAEEIGKSKSAASTAVTFTISGVAVDNTAPTFDAFVKPNTGSNDFVLQFSESLLYADASKIVLKEGSTVRVPTALGLNPKNPSEVIIEVNTIPYSSTNNITYIIKGSTTYTVALKAGAVADLAGNLLAADKSLSASRTEASDTTKPYLRKLRAHNFRNKNLVIFADSNPADEINRSKVELYSVSGATEIKLSLGIGTFDTFPGYQARTAADSEIIKILYRASSSEPIGHFPIGSYKAIFKAAAFSDDAKNTNAEISYSFTSTASNSLSLGGTKNASDIYSGSLTSSGNRNLTLKFNKAIVLPTGKKKQIFIEKKSGSTYSIVLNSDGDFSTAVSSSDDKNLIITTAMDISAGTYRLRVEMEAAKAKNNTAENEYLFERAYTNDVTFN